MIPFQIQLRSWTTLFTSAINEGQKSTSAGKALREFIQGEG